MSLQSIRNPLSTIPIADVLIPGDQRECHPAQLARLTAKMRAAGYNASYPITVEFANGQAVLVDGGHRVAAAREVGISELPYVVLPAGVSRIRHSIRCNTDGSDTRPDDVFDYASRIAALNAPGPGKMEQDAIAVELGWSQGKVSQHLKVRTDLHPRAWDLARRDITKNPDVVIDEDADVVISDITTVIWTERHFRALLKYLPCPDWEVNKCLEELRERRLRWQKDGRRSQETRSV